MATLSVTALFSRALTELLPDNWIVPKEIEVGPLKEFRGVQHQRAGLLDQAAAPLMPAVPLRVVPCVKVPLLSKTRIPLSVMPLVAAVASEPTLPPMPSCKLQAEIVVLPR